ncbi:MAG: hypothetical protein Aurels2KO_30000 [Aureliella sp.]
MSKSDASEGEEHSDAAGESKKRADYMSPRPRPNVRWECGYRALGNECEQGPSDKGVCCQNDQSTDSEPVACDTDCGCAATCELAGLRRQPSLPSHEQLGPCVPRKTDWFSRQSIATSAAVLTGGVLLLCMSLPIREQVFVPGGLSSKHSQILGNRLVSERCSQCHAPVHDKLFDGLMVGAVGEVHDEKCMDCHSSHMPDAGRGSPHDLTVGEIQLISRKVADGKDLGWLQAGGDMKTHCATCHVEHHGSGHDIAAITDARCQACHQDQFTSLAKGHPEFDGFPYRTERSIKFDHNTHAQKHFSSKSQAFNCSACHVRSEGGTDGVIRTLGFEQACASCHDEPIRAAAVGGWAILQLPSLESSSISESLPYWPEEAQYGFDGQVTPAMLVLLGMDLELQDLLGKLPADRQLASVKDRQLQKTLSTAVAKGVRSLILDIAETGHAGWRKRLIELAERKLARELEPAEMLIVEEMATGLPPDLFQKMATRWLQPASNIAQKVPAVNGRLVSQADEDLLVGDDSDELLSGGEPSSSESISLSRIKGAKHVSSGGWYLDEQLLALRYMPRGHGDLTLAAWAQYLRMIQGDQHSGSAMHDAILNNCTECHTLDGKELGQWKDWKSVTRDESVRPFTKFAHTPHLTLPTVSDCKYCHLLNASEIDFDLTAVTMPLERRLQDDFAPMKIEQCSACHRKGGAKDGCTTCHNYHVGSAGLQWSRSSGH